MMKKHSFGIVQGRLTPSPRGRLQCFPRDNWRKEFRDASLLGYNFIEMIADRRFNPKNPLWSSPGLKKIKDACLRHNLQAYSVCNDFIISHSLVNEPNAEEQTMRLIGRSALLGMKVLILPLFERSQINILNYRRFLIPLRRIADASASKKIVICLETNLGAGEILRISKFFNHSNIKYVFDSGNRVVLKEDIYSDIKILKGLIGHIHIKDKDQAGDNVLLGTGKVNFLKLFRSLALIDYTGPYVFETTRGRDPLNTARYHKTLVEFFLNEASK
ncbi:MAG: sugar phosphate isomerase/epimerase family protein [Candidatus Omnitrophota bacterium]